MSITASSILSQIANGDRFDSLSEWAVVCQAIAGDSPWRRWIDTARELPDDIVPWREAPAVPGLTYRTEGRSVVVLYATLDGEDSENQSRFHA